MSLVYYWLLFRTTHETNKNRLKMISGRILNKYSTKKQPQPQDFSTTSIDIVFLSGFEHAHLCIFRQWKRKMLRSKRRDVTNFHPSLSIMNIVIAYANARTSSNFKPHITFNNWVNQYQQYKSPIWFQQWYLILRAVRLCDLFDPRIQIRKNEFMYLSHMRMNEKNEMDKARMNMIWSGFMFRIVSVSIEKYHRIFSRMTQNLTSISIWEYSTEIIISYIHTWL